MANGLEKKHFLTDDVVINLRGYIFEVTGENIIRYERNSQETSRGCLVKGHFESIYWVLYWTHLLKDCGVKESIGSYFMCEELKKKYEEAPTLDECLDALCKQLSLMSDGAYDAYYEDCRKRHDGETERGEDFHTLPYEMEMQDIFWYILDLKEGRYHLSGNLKYEGRRGISKIETVGKKMYAKMLDLIWKMDNGIEYRQNYIS